MEAMSLTEERAFTKSGVWERKKRWDYSKNLNKFNMLGMFESVWKLEKVEHNAGLRQYLHHYS